MSYCMVISTFSSKVEAGNIARSLVESKLAACCQIIPGVESIYMWNGKLETSSEFILQAKTMGYLAENVEKFILKNHSYDTPEIIKLMIDDGNIEYLKWIECSTDKRQKIC